MCFEIGDESLDGLAVFAFGSKQELLLVKIEEERDIIVALSDRGLVNADTFDVGEILLCSGHFHIGIDYPPQAGICNR